MLWQDLRARVWLEWIDSKSNPADGLSRLGLSDAFKDGNDSVFDGKAASRKLASSWTKRIDGHL